MKLQSTPLSLRLRRASRGFTLVEVMVASIIASVVMGGVVTLHYLGALTIKEVSGQMRTRTSRMLSIDKVRYELVNAQIGSVVVSEGGHRIEFDDPMNGGATSAFFYVSDSNTLFYDDDIGDGTEAVRSVVGPIDITFNVPGSGELIEMTVKSESYIKHGEVDSQDGEVTIYLRNSP